MQCHCFLQVEQTCLREGLTLSEFLGPLQSSIFCNSVEYQILGSLVMALLRPDNLFHAHARSHFEFYVGRLLSCEIVGNRLERTTVLEFMCGCGVGFGVGTGWVERYLDKRQGKLSWHYLNPNIPDDSLWLRARTKANRQVLVLIMPVLLDVVLCATCAMDSL